MNFLKKFYKYALRYKYSFIFGSLLLILTEVANNFGNFFFKFMIDQVNAGIILDTFLQILLFFVGIKLFSTFANSLAYTLTDIYILKGARDLRVDVFTHLHNLDFSYHANKQSGSLISIMKRGDGAFISSNHEINREILSMFTGFIFVLVTFAYLNWELGITVLFIVIADIVLTFFLIKRNVKTRNAFNKEEDKITAIIVDNMINYETVKYFAKEKRERNRLIDQFKNWYQKLWGYANSFRMIDISTGLLSLLGAIMIILLALQQYLDTRLTVGELVLVLTFITTFFPKLSWFVYHTREVAKQYTDIKKYMEILDIPIEVAEKHDAQTLQISNGEIDFNNVDFNYQNRSKILQDFNLKIAAGESLALVGHSGAGKSTIVKLLLRFYDVSGGKITIDGVDIRDATKESLRKNIGVVPQEPVLFNDSIGFNIGYGKDQVTLTEIKQAAKIANLDQFIETLPQKYHTIVGERGIKLSGGQKQRLAIARMFLANPPIIIFDEATSQLDSESEKSIQEAFWKIAQDKTTIIIAHRLSTVMRSDRIIVLQDGKIMEQGSHTELIKKEKGIYQHFWDLQKGGFLLK